MTRTGHPLIGKVVRWTHGPNVLEGPATHYDDEDDELFIVPEGVIHGHYWVPAKDCVEATSMSRADAAEDGLFRVVQALGFDMDGAKNASEFFGPMTYCTEDARYTEPADIAVAYAIDHRKEMEEETDKAEANLERAVAYLERLRLYLNDPEGWAQTGAPGMRRIFADYVNGA